MTKSLKIDYPSIVDILALNGRFVLNNQGIDTIQQVARYEVFKKMADKLGLTIEPMAKSHRLYAKLANEVKADSKQRRNKEGFTPMIEIIRLPKVNPKDKDFYISIVRNIPTLFDVAKHHKKAKDSFCMVTFAGLHQPTKKVSSEAMKIISKFLKRKAFKVCRVDIAIDTYDHRPINKENIKSFRAELMPYAKRGVNLEKTSFYINTIEHERMSKIIFYDKYKKQRYQQGKEIMTNDLKAWKRFEVTFTFDVTNKANKGFIHYIESMRFIDDLYEVEEIANKAKIKSYDRDYLEYQVNSLLDNRFMNNHESKKQFNSVESLERFKLSDFRRYSLAI